MEPPDVETPMTFRPRAETAISLACDPTGAVETWGLPLLVL